VSALRRAVLFVVCGSLLSACKRDTPLPAPLPSASQVALASAAPSASVAPLLSEAAGRALIAQNCLSCHTEELVEQQRLTAAQWEKVVKKMHGWGAPVEPENVAPLVAYLAATHGLSAAPYRVPTISAGDAAAALAPQPDGAFAGGNAKRGAVSYHDLCATCHAEDGRGAALGVNLVDRPLLYRAGDFSRAVRVGRGRMPSFGDQAMPDGQLADVLAHLRTLR
jgi:mono/diheme cytochrome c family protein